MLPEALEGRGPLNQLDPRVRVFTALLFSLCAVTLDRPAALGGALTGAVTLVFLAGLPWRAVARRLIPLNVFVLTLFLTLPFTMDGARVVLWNMVEFSSAGVERAAVIALKANAIVLALTVLLGTLEPSRLGYALEWYRLPPKLTRLLLFTVRYFELFRAESVRLRRAMTVRGFLPRFNLHTLRTYGYLAGMLLVRAFDRSERVLAAMKCRGFDGAFRSFHTARMTSGDACFALAMAAATGLLWMLNR